MLKPAVAPYRDFKLHSPGRLGEALEASGLLGYDIGVRLIYVIAFGVLGVLSRYYAGTYFSRILPPSFPYGTFFINVTGSFLIGVIYVMGSERATISPDLRVGIMVGFLGGYTTFSSYCLESFRLIDEAEYGLAALYYLLSPVAGLLAVACGIFLARTWVGVWGAGLGGST